MTADKIQILPLRKSSPLSSDDTSSSPSGASDSKPAKKKRTSTPKTRSGCVTCKIRRVKCDEAKPECKRCTSTGRKCDGYVIKPRKKRSRPLSPEVEQQSTAVVNVKPCLSLSTFADVSPAEFRSLHYYHNKTAPALSGFFDSDFWLRMVFQMSNVEPSIRHAMVALGALHEQRERGLRKGSEAETQVVVKTVSELEGALTEHYELQDEFALVQYGKAITHLSSRMNCESSIEVALLACVLFVCVEFLRGDAEQAISHFKSGMNIAMSSAQGGVTKTKADAIQHVGDMVRSFLSRIELLSIIDGNELGWNYPVELLEAVPDKFYNVREARDSFVHLANLTMRFIKRMKTLKYEGPTLPDDLVRQAALLRQMDVWAETLDQILLTGTLSDIEMDAVKTLRMHQVIGSMWLRRCIFPEESAADASISDYEVAISLAESIHSINNGSSTPQNSTESTLLFDMQIVTPLYYVACSCRHPQIRRRAIALLKRTQRQEGLWDSAKAAAAAERILYYEEKNLTTLDGSELPAEEDRIHGTHVASELGTNPKVHIVTFRSLPQGMNGPWKIWREQITLP